MNIALVILHADPALGGAERYTADLAEALAGRGHNVTLLSCSFGEAQPGVRHHVLHASGHTRLRQYLQFLDSLDSHLESKTYDVVHAMLPVRHCDVYHPHAGLAAQNMRQGHLKHSALIQQKLSQFANRFNRKRRRFAEVERNSLESVTPPIVLCLSDLIKSEVRTFFPNLPEDRLVKLFNAVNLERFDPSARPSVGLEVRQRFGILPGQVVGLMIAQDFARKGLKELILAMARAAGPRFKLLVVGREDPTPYRRLAESLGIRNQVCFAGPTNDPYSFYRAADFFVLPTWHDPCSLVVLEALAMGVPVISTAFNGACEMMIDNIHGFVLSTPKDEAALIHALVGMLDTEPRRKMAQACLELRPDLSYARHLDCLHKLYNRFK